MVDRPSTLALPAFLGPAFLFILGTASTYAADFLITSSAEPNVIAQWGRLKSFMFLATPFAVFGMDQLLVREPQAVTIILRAVAASSIIAATGLSILGYAAGWTGSFTIGFVPVLGLTTAGLAFHWLRSNRRLGAGYAAFSGWRVIFAALVLAFSTNGLVDVSHLLVVAFGLSLPFTVAMIKKKTNTAPMQGIHHDIKTGYDAFRIGSSYFFSSISLAIASYGEILVVSTLGTTQDVALYFSTTVLFLYPGTMLNQFLAANLGPYIRDHPKISFLRLKKWHLRGLSSVFLIWPVLIAIGYGLSAILHDRFQPNWELACILSATGCVRLLYIAPTSFIAVLAKASQLSKLSVWYLGTAILMPLIAIALHLAGITIVASVALANLTSWTLRLAGGAVILAQLTKAER